METDDKVPFTAHLEELRIRLMRCFIAVGIGFTISYGFKEKLFFILTRPLIAVMGKDEKLIFTGLAEAFFTYLKVSFITGIIIAAPLILYEFWMFVAPGLYKKEKHILFPIVFLCSLFFIGGALFGYFVVFPFGFKFFLSFNSDTIKALPSMREYLSFATTLLIAFGAVFELPLVITCMARIGLVSVDFLRKNRKYAILIIFIVSAFLTPGPDVMSQILMAVPLMILYEVSILGAKIFGKKKKESAGEEESLAKE